VENMKRNVFVTGASGYIGNAVACAFQLAGFSVIGLVRSQEKAHSLELQNIIPLIGDLNRPETYHEAIKNADLIIHCAVDYGNKSGAESIFLKTLLDESKHFDVATKQFIYTSGVWAIGNTEKTFHEDDTCHPLNSVKWRLEHEQLLLKACTDKFHVAILRPGCVYGGSGGLTAYWFKSAQTGSVEVVGNGGNHWAMVNVLDLARAYVYAAEEKLSNCVLNIVDDTHYSVKEMALAVATVADIPESIHFLSTEEAQLKYGALSEGLLIDQQISNQRCKKILEWLPQHPGFVEGIDSYYREWCKIAIP
jgi:nucleoside-diphosphate-sugar epimerase